MTPIEKKVIAIIVAGLLLMSFSFYQILTNIEACGGVAKCLGGAVADFEKAREENK